jgi:pyridinium-3,5-biscarboxylic acid mononucleotide sulfurtransferase
MSTAALGPLGRLRSRLAAEPGLIVAFSGGVDSALLARVAHEVLGERALAVTAVSASLPAQERSAARAFARVHAIAHVEVCTDELERGEYAANGADRCYHCKSALFDALDPVARLTGVRVALGTNLDDLSDYRPGQRAAGERGAICPMVDAGLTKDDVRAASRALGLSTADKPAAACLASRVAYGDRVTPELLARIEAAERSLHRSGFARCRVRAHAGGTIARIELPGDQIAAAIGQREAIDGQMRAAGFTFSAIDLAGFRSGSMNSLLQIRPAGGGS